MVTFLEWFLLRENATLDDIGSLKRSVGPLLDELLGSNEADWASMILAQIRRSPYRIKGGDVAAVFQSVITFLWEHIPKLRVPKPIPIGVFVQYVKYGIGRSMDDDFGVGRALKLRPMSSMNRDEGNPYEYQDRRRNTSQDALDEDEYKQAILDAADKEVEDAIASGEARKIKDAEWVREIIRFQIEHWEEPTYQGLDQMLPRFQGRVGKTKLSFLLKQARELVKRAVADMGPEYLQQARHKDYREPSAS